MAVAAAIAWRCRAENMALAGESFIREVIEHVPESETKSRLIIALEIPADKTIEHVTAVLGNGSRLQANDTVPFAIWCAAHNLLDYPAALWRTVSGLGDRDTTCAMVGGVVALVVGLGGIPSEWITARERLPS
jgi:ADP-ribosylglycohydrolase